MANVMAARIHFPSAAKPAARVDEATEGMRPIVVIAAIFHQGQLVSAASKAAISENERESSWTSDAPAIHKASRIVPSSTVAGGLPRGMGFESARELPST